MTVHQAKGLEFPVVVVGSLAAQLSRPKQVDRDLGPFYRRAAFEAIVSPVSTGCACITSPSPGRRGYSSSPPTSGQRSTSPPSGRGCPSGPMCGGSYSGHSALSSGIACRSSGASASRAISGSTRRARASTSSSAGTTSRLPDPP
ncbi:hypothetical protein JDY09_06430 [Thermoleophilum album]|nr:hypothetical protein JDY09_06430 [Thermoleophilum album]